MKFSCEKSVLLSAILTASRTAMGKSPVPALEGLLIEARHNIQISGYDLKTGITCTISGEDAQIETMGDIVLNARLLSDIIRKLPEDTITFETDSGNMTTIRCGVSVYNIMGTSAEDYPDLPSVDSASSLYLAQPVLKSLIRETIFAVSGNEARPIHTGSLFENENGMLTIVSVDGYRLAMRREKIQSADIDQCSFVVPGVALSEVEKILSDNEEDTVRITLGAKHILFAMGRTVLISRRLEGEFLNYRQAIPQSGKYILMADKRDLIESAERVSLIISDQLKSPIRCTFGDGVLKMLAMTPLGKAYDQCPITGDGENLEIGFNNRYLLDALKAAPAERIRILLTNGVSPCIIGPADDSGNFLYMILPVRLKANDA